MEKFNYTDPAGVVHNIPANPAWNLLVMRKLAMNFAFYANYGVSQRAVLDQSYRMGKNWGLNMQYLW